MLTFIIRLSMLMSWSTIFFVPKKSIKKYMPVTILTSLITVTVTFVGIHYRFWAVKGSERKRLWNLLSIILGPFPVGCLWIFHLTFGKFKLYLLANLINNLIYAIGIIPFLEKANFIKYVKFSRIHHVIVAMIYSTIIYGYQLIYTKPNSKYLRLFIKKVLKL
ncbi:hypothetical protein CVD27_07060 [Neobacillus cucumis]|uniref:Uncharacterized protein n=1 Tax=Neobacillus cucumis TaxID=1740721 RepID=A0A2N5HME1_9BACI|nr:hypothetical protein CVD27_07060 [Neobacillus cucumis]